MRRDASSRVILLALTLVAAACGDERAPLPVGPVGGQAGNVAAGGSGGFGSGGRNSSGGSAGLAGMQACSLAPDWRVVDDFVYTVGEPTQVVGVAADLGGNVYAIGTALSGKDAIGILRRSREGGATWQNVPWTAELPSDIATDETGNIYVAAGSSPPVVLKSEDRGATFQNLVDVPSKPGSLRDVCSAAVVATGPGDVVVAGASCEAGAWVVLKSSDGGKNWRTITFQASQGKSSGLNDVGVDAAGRAYAVGYFVDSADSVHWLVVREHEEGQAVVSDDFQLKPGLVAKARGFGLSSSPTVVGFATGAEGVFAVVRRQTGLDTWQTIDTFESRATDITLSRGQLLVAGDLESNGVVRVRTRRSADLGTTWMALPDYGYAGQRSSFSGPLTVDASGNVYAGVLARDTNGLARWVVRKLACN